MHMLTNKFEGNQSTSPKILCETNASPRMKKLISDDDYKAVRWTSVAPVRHPNINIEMMGARQPVPKRTRPLYNPPANINQPIPKPTHPQYNPPP